MGNKCTECIPSKCIGCKDMYTEYFDDVSISMPPILCQQLILCKKNFENKEAK